MQNRDNYENSGLRQVKGVRREIKQSTLRGSGVEIEITGIFDTTIFLKQEEVQEVHKNYVNSHLFPKRQETT